MPLRRERALALEAASFYLIGTDIACDVEVGLASAKQPARDVVLSLASAFRKLEPTARLGLPDDWLPTAHASEPPQGFDAARLVVELPQDARDRGGERAIFHVICFGGLQHVLLLRGSAQSLQQHRAKVDALISSYMLLEVDCIEAQLVSSPLRHHTGGLLRDGDYENERYDVSLRGPAGWRAEHRLGGAMFRVRWSNPTGSRMWLVGQRVPAGVAAWTTELADRWLQHHCARHRLKFDGSADTGWRARDTSGSQPASPPVSERTVTLLGEDVPHRRVLHVQVYEDLLMIVDGYGMTPADERAVRAAADTLIRR